MIVLSANQAPLTIVQARNMVQYITDYQYYCPNTKQVLLGYSAGAIITMNVLPLTVRSTTLSMLTRALRHFAGQAPHHGSPLRLSISARSVATVRLSEIA